MLHAQTNNLSLIVKEKSGEPISNTEVRLVEIETRKELVKKTDAEGKVEFVLTFGKTWQIQVREIRNNYLWQVEMPERGTRNKTKTIIYDLKKYERSLIPPVNRALLNIQVVERTLPPSAKPDQDSAIYTVKLKNLKESPVSNFPVQLTQLEDRVSYRTKTNAKGEAKFKIPNGREYEIDVEGMNGFKYITVPNRPNYRGNKWFLFEPMNFTEKVVSDTLLQELGNPETGTSSRHFLTATFKERNSGRLLANQTLTISALEDGTCYRATTNTEGKAQFMLPKGKHYIYSQTLFADPFGESTITYETLVADLSRLVGIGKSNRTVFVMPVDELPKLPKGFQIVNPDPAKNWSDFFKGYGVQLENLQNLSTPYYARNHAAFIDEEGLVGIDRGFLMTTGSFLNAFGPNDSPGASAVHSYYKATNLPKSIVKKGKMPLIPVF